MGEVQFFLRAFLVEMGRKCDHYVETKSYTLARTANDYVFFEIYTSLRNGSVVSTHRYFFDKSKYWFKLLGLFMNVSIKQMWNLTLEYSQQESIILQDLLLEKHLTFFKENLIKEVTRGNQFFLKNAIFKSHLGNQR